MARAASKGRARAKPKSIVSGFQGAGYTNNRGYVYFPTLDTRREIDSYTRTEICRRARFLYANVGFVRRIINGISRMAIGPGLRPVFKTKDTEWNALAAAHFEARAGSAMTFDLGGRYNFYQAQRALLRAQLKDGDVFTVLSKTANTGSPCVRIYESHSIGSGMASKTDPQNDNWFDGVRVNSANCAIGYRILDADGNKAMDVPAPNIIPFIDYERPGQHRGISILYHAINHLLDTAEINGFLKQQVKNSALVATQITNATRRGGLSGAARNVRGKTPDGQPMSMRVEDAIRGGKTLEMEPGAELKIVTSDQPHPNTLGYLDYMARDISWGSGFSPEVLWDISRLSGGPTRFVLADAQEGCEDLQSGIEPFCRRYVNYFNAVEMNANRLRRCQDPEWWAHDYVRPRALTVDRGRDGKLYIQLQGRGMLSLERWYAEQGQDWKREMSQFIAEKNWIKIECQKYGLSMDEIFGAGIPGNPLDPAATVPVKGDPNKPDPDAENLNGEDEAPPDPDDEP